MNIPKTIKDIIPNFNNGLCITIKLVKSNTILYRGNIRDIPEPYFDLEIEEYFYSLDINALRVFCKY